MISRFFFEIVGAHFVVDAQEIIELLDVVVEVFPRFGDLLGGDVANFPSIRLARP